MKVNRIVLQLAALLVTSEIFVSWQSPMTFASQPPSAGADIVALSPDGEVVAAAGFGLGEGIKVWNVGKKFSYPSVQGDRWNSVGFSPGGQNLVATNSGVTRRWELYTGKELPSQPGGVNEYRDSIVSPDWQHMAEVVRNGVKFPFNSLKIQHQGQTPVLIPNVQSLSSLAFSPDGQKLACLGRIQISSDSPDNWSKDLYLRIFDAYTGKLLQSVVEGQTDGAKVSFTENGLQFAVAFANGKVTLFDATTAVEGKTFAIPSSSEIWPGDFFFSGDGKFLVAVDKNIQIWNVLQGQLVKTITPSHRLWVQQLVFSADKKTLAIAATVFNYKYSTDEPMVYVWNAESGELKASFR